MEVLIVVFTVWLIMFLATHNNKNYPTRIVDILPRRTKIGDTLPEHLKKTETGYVDIRTGKKLIVKKRDIKDYL